MLASGAVHVNDDDGSGGTSGVGGGGGGGVVMTSNRRTSQACLLAQLPDFSLYRSLVFCKQGRSPRNEGQSV